MGKLPILKDEIIRLRNEGKKFREIKEILGCSYSTISYHTNFKERVRTLEAMKNSRDPNFPYKGDGSRQVKNRQYITEYLKTHPCVDCGITDIRVLEFDHVRGEKSGNVSKAIGQFWSEEKLLTEIEKCDIRCCNCHRIVTRERRDYSNNTKNKNQFN